MRKTPYEKLRYPWTDDVVTANDIKNMAQDIDQALVATQTLASNFSKYASVTAFRAAAQSLTKATVTAITFDTIQSNNGAESPLANGSWYNAANPTRLTAPSACIALAAMSGGINLGSALGTSGAIEIFAGLNGGGTSLSIQGTKWAPISTVSGQQWTSALSMWKLNAGDYLELKMWWNGTPAGPFNTDTVSPPTLSLMMVGLQTVS